MLLTSLCRAASSSSPAQRELGGEARLVLRDTSTRTRWGTQGCSPAPSQCPAGIFGSGEGADPCRGVVLCQTKRALSVCTAAVSLSTEQPLKPAKIPRPFGIPSFSPALHRSCHRHAPPFHLPLFPAEPRNKQALAHSKEVAWQGLRRGCWLLGDKPPRQLSAASRRAATALPGRAPHAALLLERAGRAESFTVPPLPAPLAKLIIF